jgi:transcriptional regulator with XRE-family HTH domain
MATFATRMKRRREARRWDQKELARRAGIPFMTVYRLEKGDHRTPRMDVAVKIARALGVSLDWLCGLYEGEDSEQNPAAEALIGV